MGCCFSSDDDKNSQNGDVNERSRLLGNPVSNNNQARSGGSHDDSQWGHHGNSSQKGDEQSQLRRIVQQTTTNLIDVSTLDAHNLEQHEYMDRVRQYSQRIATSSTKIYQSGREPWLLTDVPAVERDLTADPVPPADLELIKTTAKRAAKAIKEIRVEHKEDLVVQLGIP